jgi:drug/metabolite transporter (DMT)-like permease
MELSADWLRSHLGAGGQAKPQIATPLPPPDRTAVGDVQDASVLDSWPLQLAWLILPALALVAIGVLRRREVPDGRTWGWLAGVVALDLLALAALAYAVASIVGADGRDIAAVAGVPVVVLFTWALTIVATAATVLLKRRRTGRAVNAVCLASAAWVLLALYWLV